MDNIVVVIAEVFIVLIIILLGLYFIRLFFTLRLEKRVTRFSVKTNNSKDVSFIEKVRMVYIAIIDGISKFLHKLKLFKSYGKNLNYVADENVKYPELYMISSRIFTSFLTFFIVFVLMIIREQSIDILKLIVAFLAGFILPDIFSYAEKNKKRKSMEEDLLKAVIIMNNAFKSGRSIMQAIELVSEELEGDMGTEFKKMFVDLTYGLELETVFERFYKRVHLDEVKYISSSLVMVNKTGGNVVQIFSSIEKEFYERKKLQEELFSQTALSNLVFKILVAIPILIVIFILIINPTYFNIMFNTSLGRILLLITFLIYVLYIFVVRKIAKVKVW